MNNSYLITTVGKLIFNRIFPSDFPYLNVNPKDCPNVLVEDQISFFVPRGTNIKEYIASQKVNKPFIKKHISLIIDEVFHRYQAETTSEVLDMLKNQGFKYSTVAGITVSMADVVSSEKKPEIVAEAQKVVDYLNHADFVVSKVTNKTTKRKPTAPFITSTLQRAASSKLGFGVQKTMQVAQKLYEGIELESGAVGLITYMRTDSVRVSDDAMGMAKEFILNKTLPRVGRWPFSSAFWRKLHLRFTLSNTKIKEAEKCVIQNLL